MSSRLDSRKKASGSSGNGKLLSDLESISKACYADKPRPRLTSSTASSRSKSVGKFQLPEAQMKLEDAKSRKDSFEKDKKSSIWSWKGLKALTNARSRRFNCCFSLLVHNIEGLPPSFNDVCLIVHWKRRDGELTTRPIRVHQGFAEFEERLTYSCSVHGSRSGPRHSAKYEAKHFLLYASVYNASDLDLGKHQIDLTRLLPLALEELEEEKSSGKWTTSFRLSGKARGASINVSFGYVVNENSSTEMSSNKNASESMRLENNCVQTGEVMRPSDITDKTGFCRAGSLPAMSSSSNQSSEDIKDLHEVLPTSRSELCESVNILYKKLSEETATENKLEDDTLSSQVCTDKGEMFAQPVEDENISQIDCDMTEFSVVDKGIEVLTDENVKSEDKSLDITQSSEVGLEVDNAAKLTLNNDTLVHLSAADVVPQNDEQLRPTFSREEKEKELDSKEAIMKELEAALNSTSDLVDEGFDSRDDEANASQLGDFLEIKADGGYHEKGKSLSLDDVTDSVADDFLKMLGMEHSPFGLGSESEPESPRERLLRQFEKEVLNDGGLLNFEMDDPADSTWGTFSEDHSSMFEGFKENFEVETDAFTSKTTGVKIEDLETEVLMREWGLNEKAFQHSPSSSCGGFESPVDILSEDPQLLSPLAEGLGPFVQTKDGGFIRSMNPALFRHAKSGGSLVMQASNPVVVPAEIGSEVIDILQGLAAVGIEKLSMQANKLMPLEDITGKTIQQIAWESGTPILEGHERRDFVPKECESMGNIPTGKTSATGVPRVPKSNKIDTSTCNSAAEYVCLEDLAPLAMDKIEALSMEGLRIQSGMASEEAPSNITAQSIGEFSALRGNTANGGGTIGLDGTGGLQLLDIKDNGEDVDGLMNLALTLDEWVKLDSGEIYDDDLVSERTSKILAAHHANSLDQFRGRSKGEKRRGRSRKYGLLGNNFTVALMVQLRDPLRNYEPVGAPMLALIQVERVFVPPKPKLYSTVSLLGDSNKDEEAPKGTKTESIIEKLRADIIQEEEVIPQYKINEVHVAGVKTEQQQQEHEQVKKKLWGSTTTNQQQQSSGSRWLLANGMGKKSKQPVMKSKADTLWSVSSRGHGKSKELGSRSRNPNVILPR